jgi:hypothetical protein
VSARLGRADRARPAPADANEQLDVVGAAPREQKTPLGASGAGPSLMGPRRTAPSGQRRCRLLYLANSASLRRSGARKSFHGPLARKPRRSKLKVCPEWAGGRLNSASGWPPIEAPAGVPANMRQ